VGFLVNEELMVDAGTLASGLTLDEQKRIRHILLSHLHLDHVKGIPPFVDNLSEQSDHAVVVASLSPVIQGLQTYIFNDYVFPNFFTLKKWRRQLLQPQFLEARKDREFGGLTVVPIPVNHTVETAGFIIQDRDSAWLYSGDTHLTEEIWRVAARTPHLTGVFIEVSFPNAMMDIAVQSKHLTPSLLAQEYKKIGKPDIPLYVYHMKPTVRDRIIQELAALEIPHLTVLQEGQTLDL
jgi:cAMP phosphodiesterase